MTKDDFDAWQRMAHRDIDSHPEWAVAIVHALIDGYPYLEDWDGPDGRFPDFYGEFVGKMG